MEGGDWTGKEVRHDFYETTYRVRQRQRRKQWPEREVAEECEQRRSGGAHDWVTGRRKLRENLRDEQPAPAARVQAA